MDGLLCHAMPTYQTLTTDLKWCAKLQHHISILVALACTGFAYLNRTPRCGAAVSVAQTSAKCSPSARVVGSTSTSKVRDPPANSRARGAVAHGCVDSNWSLFSSASRSVFVSASWEQQLQAVSEDAAQQQQFHPREAVNSCP